MCEEITVSDHHQSQASSGIQWWGLQRWTEKHKQNSVTNRQNENSDAKRRTK